jgi:DNA transformation protein
MASPTPEFARYCCELLHAAGPCVARRMFGGYGISTDGLTLALLVDLGAGEKLWLKADSESQGRFEAAGCERFIYHAKSKPVHLNYYSAPDEAMESPALMAPWARLALQAALTARQVQAAKPPKTTKAKAKPGTAKKGLLSDAL